MLLKIILLGEAFVEVFVTKHPHERLNEQEKDKWKELEDLICVKDLTFWGSFLR